MTTGAERPTNNMRVIDEIANMIDAETSLPEGVVRIVAWRVFDMLVTTRQAGRHARPDYEGRFIDLGNKPIPRDEPVFLIRGQDDVGGHAVINWAVLNSVHGGDDALTALAHRHGAAMLALSEHKPADLLPRLGMRITEPDSDATIELKLQQIYYRIWQSVDRSPSPAFDMAKIPSDELDADERRELLTELRGYLYAGGVSPALTAEEPLDLRALQTYRAGMTIGAGEEVIATDEGIIWQAGTPTPYKATPIGFAARMIVPNDLVYYLPGRATRDITPNRADNEYEVYTEIAANTEVYIIRGTRLLNAMSAAARREGNEPVGVTSRQVHARERVTIPGKSIAPLGTIPVIGYTDEPEREWSDADIEVALTQAGIQLGRYAAFGGEHLSNVFRAMSPADRRDLFTMLKVALSVDEAAYEQAMSDARPNDREE